MWAIPKLNQKIFNLKVLRPHPTTRLSVKFIWAVIGRKNTCFTLPLCTGCWFEAHMKLNHQDKLKQTLGKKQFLRLVKSDIEKLQAAFSGSNACFFIYTPLRIERLRLMKPLGIVSGPVPTAIPPEQAKPIQEHSAPWFAYIVRPGS